MKEEHTQKHLQQTQELYAALGAFAVKFEHVVDAIRHAIMRALQCNGLESQQLAHAMMAGLNLRPLRSIYMAVLAETTANIDAHERKIIDNLLKRIDKLAEQRNDVIHRTWYIGWASEDQDDFSTASGVKNHNLKIGNRSSSVEFSRSEFDKLSLEADALTALLSRLSACLTFGHCIDKNFIIDSNGNACCPLQSA